MNSRTIKKCKNCKYYNYESGGLHSCSFSFIEDNNIIKVDVYKELRTKGYFIQKYNMIIKYVDGNYHCNMFINR